MRKKIDSRIRTLIENNVMTNNRSFFVIVGDKGKDQVVNLHYMLSKAAVKARPSVLWCYKKELGFSSHRQKRMKQIKKQIQRGLVDPDKDDPFELFISSTNIRYCYYKETHKILGNTFGMCVLQDFEALTPNILARTIETVEGGGIVVLLLRTMKSLKQLYTMSMDVHDRYRTEAHQDVVARFNERFILSLANCESCMILDEELNVLPISSKANSIVPLPPKDSTDLTPEEKELKEIQKSLEDTPIIGPLVKNSKTTDQAKALLTFVEAISDKNLKTTVALTAGRGRGKSAALGLAIASAVANGYSNIFVTSPSPENLKTLFEFIFKGFDALGYEEHLDYDIIQSTNPDFNKAVVRVNIFREHRQTIQYIQPQDSQVLGQAELVVIDEAAAIPLPLVKALLGPYLIFMASTINGYEGTGRSLSLKLIQQLRESSVGASVNQSEIVNKSELDAKKSIGGRILREVKLEEPIRYGKGDIVEKWLNELLCLDSTVVPRISSGYPHPSECELYYVNRDTLFSYHKASESFLQRLVSLYVASHYKNSPNDLQLLSDAPAHHIFVLLPPVDETSNSLPEILAVVQVALEGEISKESVMAGLSRGERASGDLIPWTISQQFQDENFGSLSGGRVVRIAAHPDYQKMGYGSRCLEILKDYYEGKFMNLSEDTKSKGSKAEKEKDTDKFDLHSEVLAPRKNLPPLLVKLSDRPAEQLDYLGVSFGLTENLYRFWKRAGYVPVYLRQTNNELTGEYSCIMLNALSNKRENPFRSVSPDWLELYWTDFERRFVNLLSYEFRKFSPVLSMEILSRGLSLKGQVYEPLTKEELAKKMSTYDLKRIDAYIKNMADYHLIIDLLPEISSQYFLHKFGTEVSLSPVQQTILGALGLQRKTVDEVEKELSLPSVQILALFSKVIRKIAQFYESLEKGSSSSSKTEKDETKEELKKEVFKKTNWEPLEKTLDEELDETESQEKQKLKEEQKKLLQTLNLDQYAIPGDEEEWNMALKNKTAAPTSVSIKNPNSQKLKRGLEKPTTNSKEQKPDNKKQKKSKK